MRNLKIGVRLGLGFGLVTLLLITIAIMSITRLSASSDRTDAIVNDHYVKVALALQIKGSINASSSDLRNALLATNSDEAKKFLDRMKVQVKRTQEAVGKLKKLINAPEELERLKKIDDARANYIAARDKNVKLLEDQNKDKAVESLFKELIPPQTVYFSALDDMAAFQSELMDHKAKEALVQVHDATIVVIVLSVVAVMLSAIIGIFITRSITGPLSEAVQIAQTVASGDLTSRIKVTSKDETGYLLQALKDMNESLVNIVGQVRTGTDTIATASSQIASGNLDLSSRTEQQASSLEETASSMEELTSTVKQNADNARQANQLAIAASEVALKGGAVVFQVVGTMGSINESAKKIVDIISVIDGIAFQTNILALNAAVEAARAGEQGRGFAVVATEVRNLAQRSAGAAKEIKTLIGDSVEKVEAGTKLVDQAGSTMQAIVDSIKSVTDIMGEITAASQEQTAGIEQINLAITQMDDVTQQNASLVEEAAAASQSLQGQASSLSQVVSVFKISPCQTTCRVPLAPRRLT